MNLNKPLKPCTVAIKDNAAKKITEPGLVSHRCKEYCEELYSEKQEDVHIDVRERERERN